MTETRYWMGKVWTKEEWKKHRERVNKQWNKMCRKHGKWLKKHNRWLKKHGKQLWRFDWKSVDEGMVERNHEEGNKSDG